MGPKSVCTKNDPTRFSQWQISFFPTMVTLAWGQGGVQVVLRPRPTQPHVGLFPNPLGDGVPKWEGGGRSWVGGISPPPLPLSLSHKTDTVSNAPMASLQLQPPQAHNQAA